MSEPLVWQPGPSDEYAPSRTTAELGSLRLKVTEWKDAPSRRLPKGAEHAIYIWGEVLDFRGISTSNLIGFSTWAAFDRTTAMVLAEGIGRALITTVGDVLMPAVGPVSPRGASSDWTYCTTNDGDTDRWQRTVGSIAQFVGGDDGTERNAFWLCTRVDGESFSAGSYSAFTIGHACDAAKAVGDVFIEVLGSRLSGPW